MIVIVLTACPTGLRGDLTRWLLEISAGVFVGHVSAKVRDRLWERIVELIRDGRAIMVYSARNEQRCAFRVHHADWIPEIVMDWSLLGVQSPRHNPNRIALGGEAGAMRANGMRRVNTGTEEKVDFDVSR